MGTVYTISLVETYTLAVLLVKEKSVLFDNLFLFRNSTAYSCLVIKTILNHRNFSLPLVFDYFCKNYGSISYLLASGYMCTFIISQSLSKIR